MVHELTIFEISINGFMMIDIKYDVRIVWNEKNVVLNCPAMD